MADTLLLEDYDAKSPIQSHLYSYTSNATILGLFPLKNYSLFIIFWYKASCHAPPTGEVQIPFRLFQLISRDL